jgi:L-iditol 2-dehydrogenase
VKLAESKNCRIVSTDINSKRLGIAAGFGADITIDAAQNVPERLLSENAKKADVVVLCTSAIDAIKHAWECVDKGGAIVFFAVPDPDKRVTIPINTLWTREVKILTSYYCGPPDIVEAIQLIETGTISVDDLITHRLPLSDTAKGFQLVMDGKESIKVIIKPNL